MSFRSAAAPALQKKSKNTPPEETGIEASYLKALGEKQTPVTVKLVGGGSVRGWIEYDGANIVRLSRDHSPNLFIYKHDVVSIAEDGGRRGRL